MSRYPRIVSVVSAEARTLVVTFDNGVTKRYDCTPLLARPEFGLLRDPAFFRGVTVDPGGYGVSWNDDIDLAEAELWTHGRVDEPVAHL